VALAQKTPVCCRVNSRLRGKKRKRGFTKKLNWVEGNRSISGGGCEQNQGVAFRGKIHYKVAKMTQVLKGFFCQNKKETARSLKYALDQKGRN